MYGMFYYTPKFNGDLSTWDVSNVGDMGSMFRLTSIFNGDLSNWKVTTTTIIKKMFLDAAKFNRTFQWNCDTTSTYACVCKNAWDASCNCPPNQYRPVGDINGCRPHQNCVPGKY